MGIQNVWQENMPKISICIPTYNRSDLLKKTLISVSRQTIKPYEVIVVDNCSKDNTEEVVKNFKEIIYYKNRYNLGMIENWNRCIELATGVFLVLLHSDDVISPKWYEEWQRLINLYNNNTIGAYFSAVFTIDSEENTRIIYRVFSKETLLKSSEAFKILWSRNMCGLPTSGALIYRKSIFDILGKFDKAYSTEADIALALKILNQFDVFYAPQLLFAYRIHRFQSFDVKKQKKDYEKKYFTLSQHLNIFKQFYNYGLRKEYRTPVFYKRLSYMYVAIAIFYFLTFKYNNAKKYYKLTKDVFPDILKDTKDFFLLISIILHYIKKLILGRLQAIPIRNITKRWIA